MTKSDAEPPPAQWIDADEFERLATAAMRRAQRVAEKEAARYGLKLVLEKPRSQSRRKRLATLRPSRRVVERV